LKKIELQISPFFFLTAAIIGWINSWNIVGAAIWTLIIFISVLVHEYGHALVSVAFGQRAKINLIAFGGLMTPSGKKLALFKEFLVAGAGPFFSFLLFVLSSLALLFLPITSPIAISSLQLFRFINLFWTFVNLMPILPLDGGHMLRIAIEGISKRNSYKIASYVSLIFATLLAVASFLLGWFIMGAIFFLFVFQNFDTIQKLKNYSQEDLHEDLQRDIELIEHLLQNKQEDEARKRLKNLLNKTKQGVIHTLASQYLAKIYAAKKEWKKVYDLLNPIENELHDVSQFLYLQSSYYVEDYEKVIELSGSCFRQMQIHQVALFVSHAYAKLFEVQNCILWIKTALSFRQITLEHVLKDKSYDSIRGNELFEEFIKQQEIRHP
jgi:stage IV sporulation protein FB